MDKPLRIAYLTSAFARPSDTFIRHEVNQLRAMGHEVFTFSIRRPDAGSGATTDADVAEHQKATEYLLESGPLRIAMSAAKQAALHPLRSLQAALLAWRTKAPGIRGALRQCAYLGEAFRLADRLLALRVDLLHNHIGENSATVAMLASQIADVPYSLTIHGPGIFYAPEHWALGEKLDRAAFTACITDYCRSQCLVYASPEHWHRLHVVRCAVAKSFVESPARPAPADPPLFVCVGRLCVVKAQRLLIDAARMLVDEGRRCRVAIVGDGPDRPLLEQAIAEQGLEDTVSLLGWQSSEQIADLLRQARALVSCSFAEGLPIVIMESLALECPVIATRIAAIPELVETGSTGWLIPPARTDALADAMRSALTASPADLASLGSVGRARVLSRHHPQTQAELLSEWMVNSVRSST